MKIQAEVRTGSEWILGKSELIRYGAGSNCIVGDPTDVTRSPKSYIDLFNHMQPKSGRRTPPPAIPSAALKWEANPAPAFRPRLTPTIAVREARFHLEIPK